MKHYRTSGSLLMCVLTDAETADATFPGSAKVENVILAAIDEVPIVSDRVPWDQVLEFREDRD